MTKTYELHFREGFHEHQITVKKLGVDLATFEATTRLQIGLADVESLDASSGDEIEIVICPGEISAKIILSEDETYVIIDLQDGVLNVHSQATLPGYY